MQSSPQKEKDIIEKAVSLLWLFVTGALLGTVVWSCTLGAGLDLHKDGHGSANPEDHDEDGTLAVQPQGALAAEELLAPCGHTGGGLRFGGGVRTGNDRLFEEGSR